MSDSFNKLLIFPDATIKEAMRKMDLSAEKILIVVDQEKHLLGVMTDGDIRRFILKHQKIKGFVRQCFNKKPIFLREGDSEAHAKRLMIDYKITAIPVVDQENRLVNALLWNTLFNGRKKQLDRIENVPVVIMAGGKGERLDPVTRVFPKPLIPIGNKPIVELIMDRFHQYGVNDFYLTLNYKGKMVKSYFDNSDVKYNMNYLWEKKFLGTAGGLGLLPKNISTPFIVSNCDILVETDYAELLNFHRKNKSHLTLIGSWQHHLVPYGVIEFSKDGQLKSIIEKPEYDFMINTGLYVMEKDCLRYIVGKEPFHATDLIRALFKHGKKISVYPVSEKSYIDIGQWEEYKKNLRLLLPSYESL